MSISSRRSEAVGLLQDERPLSDWNPASEHRGRKGRIPQTFNMPPSPAYSNGDGSESISLMTKEERRLTRPIDRGAPGDAAIFSSIKTPEQQEFAKRKSQYYENQFAYREPNGSARERVLKESIVTADVRTNVIIQDEYTFITDLSYNLSNRYQRPESSILVSVSHSVCMLFAGSFDPTYVLTITALPSQVQPVTNKRNATLLQKALSDALSVEPSRGIVKFVSVPEENFAFNGKTILGEIEDLERDVGDDNTALKRSLSKNSTKTKKRQSMRSLRNLKTSKYNQDQAQEPMPLSPRSEHFTPPLSERATPPPIPTGPHEMTTMDRRAEKVQKVSKRKSFIQGLFSRGQQ